MHVYVSHDSYMCPVTQTLWPTPADTSVSAHMKETSMNTRKSAGVSLWVKGHTHSLTRNIDEYSKFRVFINFVYESRDILTPWLSWILELSSIHRCFESESECVPWLIDSLLQTNSFEYCDENCELSHDKCMCTCHMTHTCVPWLIDSLLQTYDSYRSDSLLLYILYDSDTCMRFDS